MADPVQASAKERRLAAALRANLRRRKDLARERDLAAGDPPVTGGTAPTALPPSPHTARSQDDENG